MRRNERLRGTIAFLIIAFGLAWLPFLVLLVQPGAAGVGILMPVAPAIACFVVRKWITREGFADSGLRFKPRHWPLYLIALLWPFAVIPFRALSALILHVAPPGFTMPWGLAAPSPLDLLTWSVGSVLLAPIIFGEEFGWRGYLQVRLLAGRPLLAAVATGLLWGVWHYPLFLVGGEPTDNRLVALILFPLATIMFSVFLGWLRLRTGSVWPGSVAHAANNGIEDNLNRLAFTGQVNGIAATGAGVSSLLAEAVVLLGIVAADHVRSRGQDSHARNPVLPSRSANYRAGVSHD